MDVNYELYKVFYYVASTLSFSEAASQLFISQSAVSQSIKTLEKKLNQTLFIRSTKKVQLTPEGEILLRHIEPAVHLIGRGEAQLMDTSAGGGQLRIGASDTICRYFLVPYLEKYHVTASLHMSMEDVMEVTEHMMDYLIGKEEKLSIVTDVDGREQDFFNEQDRLHMADVKNLFLGGLKLRAVFLMLAIVLLMLAGVKAGRKRISRQFFEAYSIALGVFLGLLLFLGVAFAIDFTAPIRRTMYEKNPSGSMRII